MRAWMTVVGIGLAFAAAQPARAIPVATTAPTVTYDIGVIMRKANNALDGSSEVLIRSPADVSSILASMQTTWTYGVDYLYRVQFETATGLVTTQVDFDRDLAFQAGETVTTATSFNGRGFRYITMLLQELAIDNLTINGTNLGTFVRGTGPQSFYWSEGLAGGLFGDIDITGSVTLNPINFTSQDIPRAMFRFGDDEAYSVAVPAPAMTWAYGLSLVALVLLRRRSSKMQSGQGGGNQGAAA